MSSITENLKEQNTTIATTFLASKNIANIEYFKEECKGEMTRNGSPLPLHHNFTVDGTIHRYSRDKKQNERDEWYVAHEVTFINHLGETHHHLTCTYKSWSDSTEYKYQSWKNNSLYSNEEKYELNKKFQQISKQIDEKKDKEYDQQAKEATQIWEKASKEPLKNSPIDYFKNKCIKPLGARYGENPSGHQSIITPFTDIEENIRALEFISLGSDGKKYTRAFGSKKGCFHIVNDKKIQDGDTIIIAEGWATGVSIFMANEGIVCTVGGSNNINNVLNNLSQTYPKSPITIAHDNDEVGKKIAYESARNYDNISLVEPKFPEGSQVDPVTGKKNTDFNDLHKICGLDEVRYQLSQNTPIKSINDEIKELSKGILTREDPCENFSMDLLPPLLRDYVSDICEITDAHPLMVTCSALTAFSVSLNTNVYLPKGVYFQDLYTNLWFLIISKSGNFKSTALKLGGDVAYKKSNDIIRTIKEKEREISTSVDENEKKEISNEIQQLKLNDPVIPSSITPEAFIQYLAKGHKAALFHNEFGHFVQNANDSGLMQTLTDLYDMPETWRKLTKTQGDDNIELPFFSICGMSTLSWVQNSLTKEGKRDVFGGFFARFLIITPPTKEGIPAGLPAKNKMIEEKSLQIKKDYEERIAYIEKSVKDQPRIFSISPEAIKVFTNPKNNGGPHGLHELLYLTIKNYNDQTKEILEPFVKRWSPEILKIAMIMELYYDKDAHEITTLSLFAAFNIVSIAIKSTAMLFEKTLGESLVVRNCRRILEYMAERGGSVTHEKLTKSGIITDEKTSRNAKTSEYEECLKELIENGEITVNKQHPKKDTIYLLKKQESKN